MSTIYFPQFKIFSVTNLILFLLIVPKINLIDIEGYHQGIRIENLISVIFFFLILYNSKNFKINYDYKFYLFCGVIFLSYIVGVLNDMPIKFIPIIRIFEYILFVLFFSNFNLDFKKIITFFKFLIIVNLIVSLLQYNDLLGHFSSKGYFEPSYGMWKATGIFSGSWELSFISSILYFIIYHKEKKIINFYFFPTLIILYLANTRGVMIPFFISIFFLHFNKFRFSVFNLILFFLVLFISYFLILEYFHLDIIILLESLMRLIFFNENMFDSFKNLDHAYYSWAYRMKDWSIQANNFNINIFTNLFGTGYNSIYYESFVFRILFANGIIGLAILLILILRVKFYMIVFLLIAGFSLDFVVSFKMFIILFLYFRYLKLLEN